MAPHLEFGLLVTVFLTGTSWVSSLAPYHDPHCWGRQVIVHLFEWKWTDIAQECERFVGPKGYCGVQVSPPMEHVLVTKDAHRPWWERYQPVSYKLTSRSGDEAQFKDMVQRCKAVGVRIYVDSVINHMAGLGRSGIGSAGSTFDSDKFDFPGVPFTKGNFNDGSKCPSHDGNVNNYGDPKNVRDCYLVGLTDLDGSQSYVQDKVAGYFNHLIDLGVAGFRIDAAKHMWPEDIEAIQKKTKDLPEGGRPFFFLEVIDRNDGAVKINEYFHEGYVTEFRYAQKVKEGADDLGRLAGVYDPGWGMSPPEHALVFVDNHDTQRGNDALTYKNGDSYKRAVAFTLAYSYGFPRVMSSYAFTSNEVGPPANTDDSTMDVTINQDGSCGNGWVCEHRWHPIGNMVRFRNYVAGSGVTNWRYQNGVLSFARAGKGFFAMGKNDFSITVQTGLPAGEYCDLISDCAIKVKVDGSGNVVNLKPASGSEPFVAFVTGDPDAGRFPNPTPSPNTPVSTQNNGPITTQDPSNITITTQQPGVVTTQQPGVVTTQQPGVVTTQQPISTTIHPSTAVTSPPPPLGYQRTIILIERWTNVGEDLFIRGGIGHDAKQGCTHDAATSPCSIPIRHVNFGTTGHYDKVNAWSKGDNFLDWDGPETGQGLYQGRVADGTPAFWSTNDVNNPAYHDLNVYGGHYWIVDVDMDCSKTEQNGFFEFKAKVNGGWENDIDQPLCTGNGAVSPPYSSKNHMARCGFTNVFHFSTGRCEIISN